MPRKHSIERQFGRLAYESSALVFGRRDANGMLGRSALVVPKMISGSSESNGFEFGFFDRRFRSDASRGNPPQESAVLNPS